MLFNLQTLFNSLTAYSGAFLWKESGLTPTSPWPSSFVNIAEFDPTIIFDIRYAGYHNFIGHPQPGYSSPPKVVLTHQAAVALSSAQSLALSHNLTLKLWDAYRPAKVLDAWVEWGKDLEDQKMKTEFYPHVEKSQLFDLQYLTPTSAHSRGSTVDVTLVALPVTPNAPYKDGDPLKDGTLPYEERYGDNSIDCGTGYDALDPASQTANVKPGTVAARNRKLLLDIMDESGFENYALEWWHYQLRDEPFPDTFFDFDI